MYNVLKSDIAILFHGHPMFIIIRIAITCQSKMIKVNLDSETIIK